MNKTRFRNLGPRWSTPIQETRQNTIKWDVGEIPKNWIDHSKEVGHDEYRSIGFDRSSYSAQVMAFVRNGWVMVSPWNNTIESSQGFVLHHLAFGASGYVSQTHFHLHNFHRESHGPEIPASASPSHVHRLSLLTPFVLSISLATLNSFFLFLSFKSILKFVVCFPSVLSFRLSSPTSFPCITTRSPISRPDLVAFRSLSNTRFIAEIPIHQLALSIFFADSDIDDEQLGFLTIFDFLLDIYSEVTFS